METEVLGYYIYSVKVQKQVNTSLTLRLVKVNI